MVSILHSKIFAVVPPACKVCPDLHWASLPFHEQGRRSCNIRSRAPSREALQPGSSPQNYRHPPGPARPSRWFQQGLASLSEHQLPELTGLPSELTGVLSELTGVNSELTGVNSELNPVPSELTGVNSKLNPVPSELTGVPSELTGVISELTGVISELTGLPGHSGTRTHDLGISAQAI
eukprot:3388329-Amphidinium_carterae.2